MIKGKFSFAAGLPGPGYPSMKSPGSLYDSQCSAQITDILTQLGFSEADLILMTTRDLNKNLKVRQKFQIKVLIFLSIFSLKG